MDTFGHPVAGSMISPVAMVAATEHARGHSVLLTARIPPALVPTFPPDVEDSSPG